MAVKLCQWYLLVQFFPNKSCAKVCRKEELLPLLKPTQWMRSSQTTFNVITKQKHYFTHFYELSSADGFPRWLKQTQVNATSLGVRVSDELALVDSSLLLTTGVKLHSIKSSYNTYVPEVVSGKIDCNH